MVTCLKQGTVILSAYIEKARCLNAKKVMLVVSEEGDYYIQTDQDYIE